MNFRSFLAWIAVLLLVSSSLALGQDDDDDEVVVEDVSEQASDEEVVTQAEEEALGISDLEFTYLFPDAPLGNIESGKIGSILIGVSNNGDSEYTIHTLEASFRYPLDFNQVLQNFTTYRYGVHLKPGEQATMSYKWPIRSLYEPAEFGFTVLVNYEDADGILYQSAGFNKTILIVDPIKSSFDLEVLFILIFVVLFIGGVAYFVNNTLISGKKTRSTRRSDSSSGDSNRSSTSSSNTRSSDNNGSPSLSSSNTSGSNSPSKDKTPDMSWIPQHNIKKKPTSKRN